MTNSFDREASKQRCGSYRKRILEISQQVQALHMASAFSCTEVVDTIYNGLMRPKDDGGFVDTFVMSKGHGCMIQYVILESLGTLSRNDMDRYCKADGILGCHPDVTNPGIEASTGSLGHGLSMAVGMAYAEHIQNTGGIVHVVTSDGELQEGSTWEAFMQAPALGIDNLIAYIDNNDFQSLGRTSDTHPNFYPVGEKLAAFGWEAVELDGHDAAAIYDAVSSRKGGKPMAIVCKTTKGKGVSYMEDVPIWHYRAPSPEEYQQAIDEIEASL
ncbi:MAG: transketolase [Mariprofundaceae bacterium]|nr:transketolase [Mariprofundaceae bacterium]